MGDVVVSLVLATIVAVMGGAFALALCESAGRSPQPRSWVAAGVPLVVVGIALGWAADATRSWPLFSLALSATTIGVCYVAAAPWSALLRRVRRG